MKKINSHLFIVSLVIFSGAVIFFYSLIVQAALKADIIFPVAELGNCKNQTECRDFCDKRDSPENIKACVTFAKKYNLISTDEAAKAEKFAEVVAKGGPGKCRNEKDCTAYCENIAHIDECVSFAEHYNLIPPGDLAEAKKIAQAVKSGANPPGACSSKKDCLVYCENSAHIDECLAFAEKANLIPPDELAQAKKFAPFIKSGQTPGACKSKTECETYCGDESHVEECVAFGEKVGVVNHQEAEMVRKFKGKSPGDCAKGAHSAADARKSCAAFCNDPTNQPVCFKFLEEAGIMTAEEATQAGSLSDFQACVPSAPPEVQQCFIDALGQDLFSAMKQGTLPFEEDIEDLMGKIREARKCVNRFADHSLQTLTENPEALACIESDLGKDYLEKAKHGEVKCGEAAGAQKKIEVCMEAAISKKIDGCFSLACSEAITCIKNLQKPGNNQKQQDSQINSDLKTKMEDKINSCMTEEINKCTALACPEFFSCIVKFQQQGNGEDKKQSNQVLEAKVQSCTKEMQKGGQRSSDGQQGKQEYQQQPTQQYGGEQQNTPPKVDCSAFASTPNCSYVGAEGSQGYNLCKQCFPNK